MRPHLQLVSIIAVLAALYFEAGHLGFKLAFIHSSTTAVWPPTGIALAALLILGLRVWPGIFAGAFLVNLTTAGDVASSVCLAAGNTIEALTGFLLVSRFAEGRNFPDRARTFLRFVVLAGLAATAVNATIGAGTLTFFGLAPVSEFESIWLHWWLGDAAGAVLIAPMLVAWSASPRPGWGRGEALEAACLLIALAGFAAIVFGGAGMPFEAHHPAALLVMPLLLWPAIRFGPRETATAAFLLSLFALLGTLQGSGPFGTRTSFATLLALQIFMGIVTVTSMVIAANTAERRRATADLQKSQKELERSNARLNATCVSDPLTGVANRRGFEARLAEELERSKRANLALSALVVDIDRFRRHNRTLGHGGGDEVLKAVAAILRSQVRKVDFVARPGGDEFVILLPGARAESARAVAERCRAAIAANRWPKGTVTVSIGIATLRKAHDGPELLAQADQALFRAKEAGRNRVAQAAFGRGRKAPMQAQAASA